MGIAGLLRFQDCVQQLHVCTLTVPAAAQGHYAPLGMCRLTWAEPLCCKVEEYNHCCTKETKNKDMQRRSVSPKGGGGMSGGGAQAKASR